MPFNNAFLFSILACIIAVLIALWVQCFIIDHVRTLSLSEVSLVRLVLTMPGDLLYTLIIREEALTADYPSAPCSIYDNGINAVEQFTLVGFPKCEVAVYDCIVC
jgi:hypothetical protein